MKARFFADDGRTGAVLHDFSLQQQRAYGRMTVESRCFLPAAGLGFFDDSKEKAAKANERQTIELKGASP